MAGATSVFFFFACVMMLEQEKEITVVETLAVTHSLWSPSLTSVSPSRLTSHCITSVRHCG